MRAFFARMFGVPGRPLGPEPVRDRGTPPSGNGASSFHLVWKGVPRRAVAVRATLEIIEPPRTDDLYFFALQTTFMAGSRPHGGGHVGLQWNRRHPGNTAVNWGGYHDASRGGGVLPGTLSPLPSRPDDPNTRDFGWHPETRYRITISPGGAKGWWRGRIEELDTATAIDIREIEGGGDHLATPMVWSEVFAPCDAPPVAVRWSAFEAAQTPSGWEPVRTVRVNYQTYGAGGCTNTDSLEIEGTIVQRTNVPRLVQQGSELHIGS